VVTLQKDADHLSDIVGMVWLDWCWCEVMSVAVLGKDVFDRLLRFYTTVATLYQGGRLGGIEVYARKPLGW
jgi:hypothetical protein